MEALDDAFLRFLVPLSGRTVDFLPGSGGLDDALTSLAFHELCGRHGVGCSPFSVSAAAEDRLVVVGSVEAALRRRPQLAGRRFVVLPGSISGFAELENGLGAAATVFWRDRTSQRMAILQGLPPDRAVLCHDLAVHLDAAALGSDARVAEGSLTLDLDGPPAAPAGDRILVRLDGRGDRWASPHRCRSALRGVAALIALAAEIRTDSPSLAILAARLGRTVRLKPGRGRSNGAVFDDTIALLHPAVTFEPDASEADGLGEPGRGGAEPSPDVETPTPEAEVARLRPLVTAARREAQHLAQERDRLFVEAAELRTRIDAEAVAIARSHREAKERAEDAERRATGLLAEAEALAAREHDAATGAAERLSAVEAALEAAGRDATAREAAARDAAGQEAAEARHAAAAREAEVRQAAAAREAALDHRLAASEAALDARTRQALALQAALDELEGRAFATEGRVARMRALVDARTAAADEARRDAEAIRRRFEDLASSTSWRLTRPFRGVSRGLRRLAGAAVGGRHG